VLEELARLRDGVSDEELLKAKELSKGRLLLRLEDTGSRQLAGGRSSCWPGLQRRRGRLLIEAVTVEDLRRVAADLLVTDQLYLALVGPSAAKSASRPSYSCNDTGHGTRNTRHEKRRSLPCRESPVSTRASS